LFNLKYVFLMVFPFLVNNDETIERILFLSSVDHL